MEENPSPAIHDLYPELTETELAEAEDNLERYAALVLRILERTQSERNPQPTPLTRHDGTLPCTLPRSDTSPNTQSP
jgi:hypothetical protein